MRTKISFKFQVISKFPFVKNCACLLELPGTEFEGSVAPSVGQLGLPCVKRGEGFCYFDCNFFYFGRIKLLWYSR